MARRNPLDGSTSLVLTGVASAGITDDAGVDSDDVGGGFPKKGTTSGDVRMSGDNRVRLRDCMAVSDNWGLRPNGMRKGPRGGYRLRSVFKQVQMRPFSVDTNETLA